VEYYPIFMDIKGKPCVVIGGGRVAERKVLSLLNAGAKVCVVSPRLTDGIKKLVRERRVKVIKRAYKQGDIDSAFLAYSATDKREINREIFKEAKGKGILLNVVDVPDMCNFIVPSVVERGDLLIAISTSGKSPALAKRIRKRLGKEFGEEYAVFVKVMGCIRRGLLKKGMESHKNKKIFEKLVNSSLMDLIKQKNRKAIDTLLKKAVGKEFTLAKMKIKLGDR